MNACPCSEQLRQLLAERLSDADRDGVEAHVEGCPVCQGTLEELTVGVTRGGGRSEGAAESWSRHEPDSGFLRRLGGKTPQTDVPADEARDFLGPAEGPGELGRLGPYRVLEVLGSGGMGVVFRAEHLRLGRAVALKALRPALAASASACERFRREARAAAGISHDHVITVYEEGEDRGLPFLAMPLLAGETLEVRLQREGRLGVAEVLRIGREIAAGLAAAHAHQLIHRDVKPANVWLEAPGEPGPSTTGGRVKLLDFGLVRALDGDARLTQSGLVAGTPHYVAPEQAGGEPLDGRADLYGLGVVLYRMLTGRTPYAGNSMLSYLESLASGPPPPPAAVEPAVPEALSNLVLRLLARSPADRPASAAALVAELAALQHILEIPSETPGTPVSSVPSRVETVAQESPPGQPGKRRWAIVAGVAAAVLLGLAALVPYLPTGHRPPLDTRPETPAAATAPAARVQVVRIDAEHFTGDTGERCGLLGVDSFVTHRDDSVKVASRLSRPAAAYLISFSPDGGEELLYPEEDAPPPEEDRPRYPWRPEDRAKVYALDDGEGLQVFAVVVLRRPMPYREWKARRGPGPWTTQAAPRDVVWWDDGMAIERQTADDRRKGRDVPGASQVAALTDWLKKAPEVETAAALGFAVVGKNRR
jgi:serine/threonine protein kinase